MSAHEFVWNRLFEPIGFSGIDFRALPGNDIRWISAVGVMITPPYYARLAYVLLRDGQWADREIVDPGWIRRFIN